jgi:uncharacterized protein YggT (Ycf19 family)
LGLIGLVTKWLALLITVGTIIFASLFFLRVILKWMNVNPFAKIPYHLTRITEPMVRPMRSQFLGPSLRYDLVPLIMGALILMTGLFIANLTYQIGGYLDAFVFLVVNGQVITSAMLALLIRLLGVLYVAAIFLRFFLPYFGVGYMSKFFRFLFVITEPVLKPIRRFFVLGMFDFSPIVAMIVIQFLTGVIANAVSNVV